MPVVYERQSVLQLEYPETMEQIHARRGRRSVKARALTTRELVGLSQHAPLPLRAVLVKRMAHTIRL